MGGLEEQQAEIVSLGFVARDWQLTRLLVLVADLRY